MNERVVPRHDATVDDDELLRSLGVEPRLKRAVGFITGTLFVHRIPGSTTGALLITGAMLALGGPAFIWTIPIIWAFQVLIALAWAELNSHYPLSGGIYQWAKYLGGSALGWMTGVFYLLAIILVMPAIAVVINSVAGITSDITVTKGTEVAIAVVLTTAAALLMITSVRIVALINSIGVVMELLILVGVWLIFCSTGIRPWRC